MCYRQLYNFNSYSLVFNCFKSSIKPNNLLVFYCSSFQLQKTKKLAVYYGKENDIILIIKYTNQSIQFLQKVKKRVKLCICNSQHPT